MNDYSDCADTYDKTYLPDEDVSTLEDDEIMRHSERIMTLQRPNYNLVATDPFMIDPGSPKEAFSSCDADLWRNAMKSGLN